MLMQMVMMPSDNPSVDADNANHSADSSVDADSSADADSYDASDGDGASPNAMPLMVTMPLPMQC